MKEPNFEEKLKELEQLSSRIKTGELALDEAISSFEKGMKLAAELEKEISTAERKVEILIAGTEDSFGEFREEL